MQQIVVILLVAAAVAYVLRKAYRFFFSTKTDCDGCAFSPHKETSAE